MEQINTIIDLRVSYILYSDFFGSLTQDPDRTPTPFRVRSLMFTVSSVKNFLLTFYEILNPEVDVGSPISSTRTNCLSSTHKTSVSSLLL